MTKFKRKEFSSYILSDTLKGAGYGATAGTFAGALNLSPTLKGKNWIAKVYNSQKQRNREAGRSGAFEQTANQRLLIAAAGTLIGAALGAIVGTAKTISEKISQHGTDNRLLKNVMGKLGTLGYKEGIDYTRDPETANRLRTKVCLVITRDAANISLLVNMVNDNKLSKDADKILRSLPGKPQIRYSRTTDKYNDITISTISKSGSNADLVTNIVDGFIKAGYPVYLVEVG